MSSGISFIIKQNYRIFCDIKPMLAYLFKGQSPPVKILFHIAKYLFFVFGDILKHFSNGDFISGIPVENYPMTVWYTMHCSFMIDILIKINTEIFLCMQFYFVFRSILRHIPNIQITRLCIWMF